MRNTLAFLAALVLVVAGVGWYLGWYHIYPAPAPEGHQGVHIDINAAKVTEDLKKGENEVLSESKQRLQAIVDKNKPAAANAGTNAQAPPDQAAPSLLPRIVFEETEEPPPAPSAPGLLHH